MDAEEIFKKWGRNVCAYPQEALQDFDIGMKIVKRNAFDVRFLSSQLKDNVEIAKQVVGNDGEALGYLSDNLKDNEEIVRMAIESSKNLFSEPLKHASDRLKDNKELALFAVSIEGGNLAYVSQRLKDDESVVDKALENDPLCLTFASDRIKHIEKYALQLFDQQYITSANARYGLSKDIDNRHLGNKNLMKKVAEKNPVFIKYITSQVRGYREVLKEISKDKSILYWVEDSAILDDKELVCLSLKNNGDELAYVSKRLKDDKDVVITAVKNSGCALMSASERLKNEIDIVNIAILSDRRAKAYVGEKIKDLFKNDEMEEKE